MNKSIEKKPIILLVEDDRGDQELILRSIEEGKINVKLYIVEDGEEALDYLFHKGKYENPECYPMPDLVLLDINLPKLDGKETLRRIRESPELKNMVVIALTTSTSCEDITEMYRLGVNSYIAKPLILNEFTELIKILEIYWFKIVLLPIK